MLFDIRRYYRLVFQETQQLKHYVLHGTTQIEYGTKFPSVDL